jgi:hypothetical protein
MTMIRSKFLTLMFALFGAAFAPGAFAETGESADERSAPSEKAAPSPSYTDAELHSFVVAALEVERIKATYIPKLAENLREQQQVKQAASEEMVQALKQHGMSVDKFQEMLSNVQADPALAAKVNQYLKDSGSQQKGKKSPGEKSPDQTSPGDESGDPKGSSSPRAPEKGESV